MCKGRWLAPACPRLDTYPILTLEHFQMVKPSVQGHVSIDVESQTHAHESMCTSLYAKFLRKVLPLDQAKHALSEAWKSIGNFKLLNLPNGFYFIQCESIEIQQRSLYNGPWNVSRRILQLALWGEGFQPVFKQLTSDTVWINYSIFQSSYGVEKHLKLQLLILAKFSKWTSIRCPNLALGLLGCVQSQTWVFPSSRVYGSTKVITP